MFGREPIADIGNIAECMTSSLHTRGPDGQGIWVQEGHQVALGHRRLAVNDLSDAGKQPMISASARYVISFNGEIYNHRELAAELMQANVAPVWRGRSDTEVLLAAIEHWGIDAALDRLVGMFAFALWDCRKETLQLARDRFGEKPLYYGWASNSFIFGSELKALCSYPEFQRSVDREALSLFMRYMVVPAPRSIFTHAFKLEPGCILTVERNAPALPPRVPIKPGERYETLSIRRWWNLSERFEAGHRNQFVNQEEAMCEIEFRLMDAVMLQSKADVPLGVFLSGGIDSSLIAALMQSQSTGRVQTFTIGSENPQFDESSFARDVAARLGTEHSELFVSDADVKALIPQLPVLFDEPFADSSQIPTYMVSCAARRNVTVSLSGDAGDELFGGYNRYLWAPAVWQKVSRIPYSLRQMAFKGLARVPETAFDLLLSGINAQHVGYKSQKLIRSFENARSFEGFYGNLISDGYYREFVMGAGELSEHDDLIPWLSGVDPRTSMMLADTAFYLPNDILIKLDRSAMAVGLETRAPFLDHRVAEAAWRLPIDMRFRGNKGKFILREILYKHVPQALIDRPKMGFSVPIGQWLQGALRDWAEALLDEGRLRAEGYFDPVPIRTTWHEHLSGRRDMAQKLWPVLMFQCWKEHWVTQ